MQNLPPRRPFESLAKLLYFGDFLAIPIAILALLSVSGANLSAAASMAWFFVFGAGLVLWSLVEYIVHRFIYHRIVFFKRLHDAHHDDPKALLGFPSFVSSGIILGAAYLPLRHASPIAATALTSGLLAGYALYMFVHHATHHFVILPGDRLYNARLRHMAHHYRDPPGDFGVSTDIWDRAFHTRSAKRDRAVRA